MSKPVNFETATTPGVINLAPGQPSADLLPTDLLAEASKAFFASADPQALNYGPKAGDERFREAVAGLLTRAGDRSVAAEELVLSAGNSQALDYVCQRFTQPGDVVLVEEPTYFLAYQIFRDHGLRIIAVDTDDEGLDVEALAAAARKFAPKLVYTIPSYHNPTGRMLSRARRERLIQLSRELAFLVVADEVYQLLYYGEAPPPALGHWSAGDTVLSLGSFSKILAPGIRLGWIQAGAGLREKLLAGGALSSGGSFNHCASHLVRCAIESGRQEAYIQHLRSSYAERLDAMDEALHEHLGDLARWHKPGGGYFVWLELPASFDTLRIKERAADFGTGFMPGTVFSATGALHNCLRLSFAPYDSEALREGVARLARLLRS